MAKILVCWTMVCKGSVLLFAAREEKGEACLINLGVARATIDPHHKHTQDPLPSPVPRSFFVPLEKRHPHQSKDGEKQTGGAAAAAAEEGAAARQQQPPSSALSAVISTRFASSPAFVSYSWRSGRGRSPRSHAHTAGNARCCMRWPPPFALSLERWQRPSSST